MVFLNFHLNRLLLFGSLITQITLNGESYPCCLIFIHTKNGDSLHWNHWIICRNNRLINRPKFCLLTFSAILHKCLHVESRGNGFRTLVNQKH